MIERDKGISDETIKNILKVREGNIPLVLEQATSDASFSVTEDRTMPSWFPSDKVDNVQLSDLRIRVEPWLTSLFQSEHLSLLTGTGLSIAVEYMATGSSANAMTEPELDSYYADDIKARAKAVAKKTRVVTQISRTSSELSMNCFAVLRFLAMIL